VSRSLVFGIRVSPEERDRLDEKAEAEGYKNASTWARAHLGLEDQEPPIVARVKQLEAQIQELTERAS